MYFAFFNITELHRGHRAFSLSYEIYMLYFALIESYRPVRIVLADRSRDIETIRQLDVYCNSLVCIKLRCKVMLVCAIIYDMIVEVLLSFHSIDIQLALDSRLSKYFRAVMVIKSVIGDMLNDSRCFLLVDKLCGFEYEFFRIILVLLKYRRLNSCHDTDNIFSCKPCLCNELSDKIVFYALVSGDSSCFSGGLVFLHSLALFKSLLGVNALHRA